MTLSFDLAYEAHEILVRRGWSIHCHEGKFVAMRPATVTVGNKRARGSRCVMEDDVDQGYRDCPFVALVDADRWMKAQEERRA